MCVTYPRARLWKRVSNAVIGRLRAPILQGGEVIPVNDDNQHQHKLPPTDTAGGPLYNEANNGTLRTDDKIMSVSPVSPMQVSSSPPKPKPKRNNTKMATGRQSLNDMLNFSLPPRQTHVQSIPRRSRRTGNQQGIWNKESE